MIEAKETLTGVINPKQTLGGSVNVSAIEIQPELEDITITPTKEQQTFTHENSYGYDKITVNPIPEIKLQDKEVTPNKETQNIVADNNYDGLNQVTIEPIPDEYIVPEGTLEIVENEEVDVTTYKKAKVDVKPTLQDKSITITENGTQNISADSGYDGLGNVEVITNIEGVVEPEPEPNYIQDGLIAWWEGCDDVDSNGYWRSRVGDDYIKNASGYSSSSIQGASRNAFYFMKKENAYQNNMLYGLVTNKDYYYEGYTIEFVGKARSGGNEALPDSNVAAPLIAFDKGSAPMIANFGSNGFFACVNQYQDSYMPKLFTNCYGKRYKYAITLDKLVPRGTSSGQCQVSYSLNNSQWYQRGLANVSSGTEKGSHMVVLAYHWDTYKSNSEVNSIRVYNRRLTEEELKHNYEIDKARFNLDEYTD